MLIYDIATNGLVLFESHENEGFLLAESSRFTSHIMDSKTCQPKIYFVLVICLENAIV